MDLIFNKKIESEKLKAFLESEWPRVDCYIISDLREPLPSQFKPTLLIISHSNESFSGEYKHGISIGYNPPDFELFLKTMAYQLSNKFDMGVLYGTTGEVTEPFKGPHYSILYLNHCTYLVDDFSVDIDGEIRVIKEINLDNENIG